MFSKRITAALFAMAIASSLIVVSGGLVGFAFAAKKDSSSTTTDPTTNTIINSDGTDKSSSPKSRSANAGDSIGATGNTNDLSAKELKKLSKCQSGAAADGDLTLGEVKDCYRQVYDQGGQQQGQGKEDQSSSPSSYNQSEEGQGEQQQKSSSLNGQKIGTMREGFPF
jgi:hypothetical protein